MTEKTTNKKKLVIISSVAAAVMVLLMILMLSSCKGNTNTENAATADEVIGTSIQTITEIVTDAQGSTQVQEVTEVVNVKADGTVEKAEDSTKPTEKETNDNKKLVAENGSSSSKTTSDNSTNNNTSSNSSAKVENQNKPQNTNTNSNSNSSSATSKPSSNSSTTSTSKPSGGNTTPTTSSKVWHEAVYEYIEHPAVTEQVWVVDKEAYTYEEPVYEYKYRTLCNDCDMDITDYNVRREHMIYELENGGKGSYRNEKVKFQTGTETITVPEQGHYETRIIKEAYTEKKLLKEAGYY